jgi:ribonuclease P protein subunit POP4
MPRKPENLERHELIGLKAEVVKSPDQSQEDIRGEVTNETRNTLNIGGKKVPKKGRNFSFTISGQEVKISGDDILERPEDRT